MLIILLKLPKINVKLEIYLLLIITDTILKEVKYFCTMKRLNKFLNNEEL